MNKSIRSEFAVIDIADRENSFETKLLRREIRSFMQTPFTDSRAPMLKTVGACKYGVYVFYDYDREPIYVGQTRESVSSRIGRHLTNQRTDAVAMNVLDPFEVYEIAVWPLPQYQSVTSKSTKKRKAAAQEHLDDLEAAVFRKEFGDSKHGGALNEKFPRGKRQIAPGEPAIRGRIVSTEVLKIRGHPDTRIARRADTIARLARVINERKVQPGLRRTLVTQAKRLENLASERFRAFEEDAKKEDAKD